MYCSELCGVSRDRKKQRGERLEKYGAYLEAYAIIVLVMINRT